MLVAYHPWSTMDQDQQYSQDMSYIQYSGNWMDNREYQNQQQGVPYVPMQMAMPGMPYGDPAAVPRASHPQLQPLVSGQWHGMHMAQGVYPGAYSMPPGSVPGLMPPKYSHHTPTPRKTLTDADRRSMCRYAEENPTKKQTEIGEIYGVERSTVSKVLRNKEKYLSDNIGTSTKRGKGKLPDIERALAKWAQKQNNTGVKLTDEAIREQANMFCTSIGEPEAKAKLNSSTWLERFKLKHSINGVRSRRSPASTSDRSTSSAVKHEDVVSAPSSRMVSPANAAMSRTASLKSSSENEQHLARSNSSQQLYQDQIVHQQQLQHQRLQQQQQQHHFQDATGHLTPSTNPFSTDPISFGFPSAVPSHLYADPSQQPQQQLQYAPAFHNTGYSPHQNSPYSPGTSSMASSLVVTPQYTPLPLDSQALYQSHTPAHQKQQSTGYLSRHHRNPVAASSSSSRSTPASPMQRLISRPHSAASSLPTMPPSEHDVRLALATLGSWFESQPTDAISEEKYHEVVDTMERLRAQTGLNGGRRSAGGGSEIFGAGNQDHPTSLMGMGVDMGMGLVGLPEGVPVMSDGEEEDDLDLGFQC